MKKQFIYLLLLSGVLIFSCGKPQTKQETTQQASKEHVPSQHGIELNEGNKWKVDEQMMVYLRAMEKAVEAYTGDGADSFDTLAIFLQEQTNGLTSNCTMEGKPHDELHKWLLPYMELVTSMQGAKDETQQRAILLQLNASFTELNTYFE
jgi:hypothetical protein